MRRVLRKGALVALFLCIALLFAACTVIEYRITFSLGEHAAQEAVVPETEVRTLGRSFRLPEAPAAEAGWEFAGWTDGDRTFRAGEIYIVLGNATLTAVWQERAADPIPETVTVSFLLGEHGSGAPPSAVTCEKGEKVSLPQPTAQRGYAFEGWYLGEEKLGAQFTPQGDCTITARFILEEYTITYLLPEGIAAEGLTEKYTVEDDAVMLPALTARGYLFEGWTEEGTGAAIGAVDPQRAENVTVRAHFTLIQYNISYVLDGGTNAEGNPHTYHIEDTFTLAAPTREGYDFVGWTYGEVTEPEKEVTIPAGTTGELTFTAHWELHRYRLTVDGEIVALLAAGETYTLKPPVYEVGSTFMGWAQNGELIYTPEQNIVTMGYADIALTTRRAEHDAISDSAEFFAALADENAGTLSLACDVTFLERVTVERPLTVALCGRRMDLAGDAALIVQGTSFFLMDGSLRSEQGGAILTAEGSSLTLRGVTVESGGVGIEQTGGTLTMESCTFDCAGAFAVNISSADEADTVLKYSTMTAQGTALLSEGASLRMTECFLTGGEHGMELLRGEAEGAGGRIRAEQGAAVVVGNENAPSDAALTLQNAEIVCEGVAAMLCSDETHVVRINFLCDDAFLPALYKAGRIKCTGSAQVAEGHAETFFEERAAGCGKDGWRAHYFCARCGAYFDEKGDPAKKEEVFLPAPSDEHEYVFTYDAASGALTYGCRYGDTTQEGYYVEFDAAGGELTVEEDAFLMADGEVLLDLAEVHISFSGGEVLVAFRIGNKLYAPDAIVRLTENFITAVIETPERVFTVTFSMGEHAADGVIVPEARRVKEGEAVQLPAPPAVQAGYSFAGWLLNGELLPEDFVPTTDVTLTASYAVIEYPITYSLNGGENSEQNPAYYTVEQEVILAAPVREGYVFLGWTAEDAEGYCTRIPVGSTGARTFTAHWEKVRYALVVDGEQLAMLAEGETYTVRAPAREGATFLGWQDEAGERVSALPEYTLTMGRTPISLTAQWAEHAALQSGEALMAALGDERAQTLALAADVTVTEIIIARSVSLDLKGYSLLGETIVITGAQVRIFGGRMTFSGSEGISFTGETLELERLTLDAPNGTALTFAGEKLSVMSCTVRGGAYGVWLLQGSGEMMESVIAGSVGASVVVGNCLAGKYPENAQCHFSHTRLTSSGGIALLVLSDLADGTSAQASFACNDVLAEAFAEGQIVASEGAAVERLHGELRRVARKSATCVAEGVAEHHVCDDCGALFVLQEGSYYEVTAEELALPATGEHVFPDEYYSDYVPPTCTEDGTLQRAYCPDCGTWFCFEDGLPVPVEGMEALILPALGHETELTFDPFDGYFEVVCTREGETISYGYVASDGDLTAENFRFDEETGVLLLILPAPPISSDGGTFAGWQVTNENTGETFLLPAGAEFPLESETLYTLAPAWA